MDLRHQWIHTGRHKRHFSSWTRWSTGNHLSYIIRRPYTVIGCGKIASHASLWPAAGEGHPCTYSNIPALSSLTLLLDQRLIREVNACLELQREGPHQYICELLGVLNLEEGQGRPGIVLQFYENNDALVYIKKKKFTEDAKGGIVSMEPLF